MNLAKYMKIKRDIEIKINPCNKHENCTDCKYFIDCHVDYQKESGTCADIALTVAIEEMEKRKQ